MSAKKIYSNELKLEIVQRYLNGNVSFSSLVKEYHVNKSDIIKWKAAYEEHGLDGLTTKNGTYSGDQSLCDRIYTIYRSFFETNCCSF